MPDVGQAMLLAAGLSTRTRPLTEVIPKPLLPFWDRQLLDFTLAYLEHFGIGSVAVNVHHGRVPFLKAIRTRRHPKLVPFLEKKAILGTGGGVKHMRTFVTEDTFLVANCDFLTDVDLHDALAFHERRGALATLVLLDRPDAAKYGRVAVDAAGRISAFPETSAAREKKGGGIFSGIHVLNREIFNHMPARDVFCIIRDVYAPLVRKRAPVYGRLSPNRWYDLGEIKPYAEAQFRLLERPFGWMRPLLPAGPRPGKGIHVSGRAKIDPTARLTGPVLIAQGARVEAGARLGPHVIMGARSAVKSGSSLRRVLLFPGARTTPAQPLTSAIVLPPRRKSPSDRSGGGSANGRRRIIRF